MRWGWQGGRFTKAARSRFNGNFIDCFSSFRLHIALCSMLLLPTLI